jgi:RNA polymerase sigma-70 factor (ECF subfamily)
MGARVVMNGSLEHRVKEGSEAPRVVSPAAAADHSEQLARLDKALDELPDRERLAIHLYYLDADPVGAASVCMGLSRSGFYKLLNKAKERLATLMGEARIA